ncbi:hypothetical protein VTI28DRAFT_5753 [Corynascus sepedonium]
METRARYLPELRPVLTGRSDQDPASPRTLPHSATSPLYSASLTLPSPMYSGSPSYDYSGAHERALVDRPDWLDRLDRNMRRRSQQSPTTAHSLSPISEQRSKSTRRASTASLPLPHASAPSPRSPGFIHSPGKQTIAAQTREILLKGVSDKSSHKLPASASPSVDCRRSLTPLLADRRRNSQEVRDVLRSWGHIYLDHAPIADCLVTAVGLRRHSDSSPIDEATAAKEVSPGGGTKVTIRALVKPCAPHRKPFLLRREFDMDGLRATIPEPSPVSAGSRPSFTELTSRCPLPTSRRRSFGGASARHGLDMSRSHVRSSANAMPIHKKYALAFFPVLAALLYSGLVAKGDTIEIPLPHPEVWARTVAYAYTGQEELTEAIKQNIVHLGGKV